MNAHPTLSALVALALLPLSGRPAPAASLPAPDREEGPGPAAVDPRPDSIVNGGFENGLDGWGHDPRHQLVRAPRVAHSGQSCVMGEVSKPDDSTQLRQTVRVSAKRAYEFEMWARATNRAKLVLFASLPGDPPQKRTRIATWEDVPTRWQPYRALILPERDGEMQLHIIAPSSFGDSPLGKMWIDEVSLRETPIPQSLDISGTHDPQNPVFHDEPAMDLARDGSLYLAWNRFEKGSDSLRAARCAIGPDGTPSTIAEWDVLPGGRGVFLLHPRVIATDTGAALVYSAEVSEGDWDLFVVTLGPGGPSKPIPVTRKGGIDVRPSLAWRDGALWVAWESNRSRTRAIYLARVQDGRVAPLETVAGGDTNNYEPSVATLADGRVAVAWHSFREDNYDIHLRTRAPDGTWSEPRRLTRAASVDWHAALHANGDELWITYENALCPGYSVGTSQSRSVILARVANDGSLSAPLALDRSPLAGRCEAAQVRFDRDGRIWVAHLRPRGQRDGWDAYLTAYTGSAWTPPLRTSALLGIDRQPHLALPALTPPRAIVVAQKQDRLRQFDSREEARGDTSRIELASIELRDLPAATAMRLEPLVEPATPFEPAPLRQQFGEGAPGSPSPTIQYRGQTLRLVYGDLHEHTDVSQCGRLRDQAIDESYDQMRDIARLDFAAATDHGYNITPYLWNYTAKLARVHHDPQRFLTFLGEEWTSSIEEYSPQHPYGFYGHRNLILADTYFPLWWNARERATPRDIWNDLRKERANFIQIPHQLADTGNVPTDWNYADETAQPVAEIFQVRGSYEYKGAPREASRSTPERGSFLQDAWARDIVIGVIASPDHGGGRGKACVFTADLTREAILDALRARRCFGTTAARIFLDTRVNGAIMGEKIPRAQGPVRVEVTARCPGDIDRIEVCRNNEFVYSTSPGGREASFTFQDTAPVDGRSYYYVRLIQTDREMAWSSPVWIGYP